MLEARLEWLGWMTARSSSFVSGKPSRVMFLASVEFGHKSLSLGFTELVIWNGNKNYFSILEYFLSANGSVTGSPCCISKKSSLFLDASPWPSVGSPFLKYLSSGAFF